MGEDIKTRTASRRFTWLMRPLPGVMCLMLSIGLVLLTWAYVIQKGPGNIRGMYDVYRYYSPLTFFYDYAVQHGEFPMWNQLTDCGVPSAANPQTFAMYPPNFLRALLNAEPTPQKSQATFAIMLGIHLVLTNIFMYLLARAHGLSRGASYAAAFAYTFSALMVRRAGSYHFVTTLTWLPLLLTMAKHMLDAPRLKSKVGFAAAGGVFLGLSILGGFIHIVPYIGVILFTYCVGFRILHPRSCQGTRHEHPLRLWVYDAVAFILILAFSAMVASALLLPLSEMAEFTERGKGAEIGHYSDTLNQPPLETLQDLTVYAGMKFKAEALRGAGIIALLLVLASFTSPRWRLTLLFLVTYLVLLDCSLGPPLPTAFLLDKVTPFAMSAYSRAYDLALLPLAMLTGLGLDAMVRPLRSRGRELLRTLLLWAPLVLLPGATLLVYLSRWTEGGHWLRVTPAVIIVPAVAVGMLAVGSLLHGRRTTAVLRVIVALLLFGETFAWSVHYVPYLCHGRFRHPQGQTANDVPAMPQDNSRQVDPRQINALLGLRNCVNGYDPLYIKRSRDVFRSRLSPRARAVRNWEVTTKNNRANLLLKRSFWLARQWVDAPLPGKSDLFPAATTVFLNGAKDLPVPSADPSALPKSGVSADAKASPLRGPKFFGEAVKGTKKTEKAVSFRLPAKAPGQEAGSAGAIQSVMRLYYTSTGSTQIETTFVGSIPRRTELGKTFNLGRTQGTPGMIEIPLPDFQRGSARFTVTPRGRNTTFQFTRGFVLSDMNDEDGKIRIVERKVNSVEVELAELDDYRILTFLDAMYPGWKAFLDGEPVDILLADDAFKAVVVPPGTHRVKFVFKSRLLAKGVAISIFGTFLALLVILACRWRRPRPADEENSPVANDVMVLDEPVEP